MNINVENILKTIGMDTLLSELIEGVVYQRIGAEKQGLPTDYIDILLNDLRTTLNHYRNRHNNE